VAQSPRIARRRAAATLAAAAKCFYRLNGIEARRSVGVVVQRWRTAAARQQVRKALPCPF